MLRKNRMTIEIVADGNEMGWIAARTICRLIDKKPNAVLGLATGSTPLTTYEHLVGFYKRGAVSFSEVTTFNLDEYVGLEEGALQSYAHYMDQYLFDHVDMNREQVYLPDPLLPPDEACANYEDKLRKNPVDLQILGLGSNGHIGFNEPGTSFEQGVHLVQLAERTRHDNARFFESPREVPTRALTMGPENIMRASHIILLVDKVKKIEALTRLLTGPVTEDCPVTILRNHPSVCLYVTEEVFSAMMEKREEVTSVSPSGCAI